MKIIDLLNKIANGNIPKRIIYDEYVYQWNNIIENYERETDINTTLNWDYITINCLNEPVEILEEKEMCHKCHKYPTEYNQTYCEFCLGISKLEEKKIPEKLDIKLNSGDENKVNYYRATNLECDLAFKINEIIDYLKSKGE